MRTIAVPVGLALAVAATALVFVLDPTLDLTVASAFYAGQNRFTGQTGAGEAVRRIVYWVPAVVAAVFVLLYALGRLGRISGWAPSGRAVLVVLLSFAIGPGLLTNVLLKDHAHRPRPYQTIEFGGSQPFRPFYRFDGACARNCSFVSGEGSAAFWTVIPAAMLPPPAQAVAIAAALVFGAGVGTLRMAFGGHYLSDTIFAALFTWSVGWILWRALLGRGGAAAGSSSSPPDPSLHAHERV